jgi:ABC-type Fe2+-enterobactin transport system substrate-binding protein
MNREFSDAIAILGKAEEEQRNWNSARTQLGKLFQAAIQAEKTLAEFDKAKAARQAEIANLDGQKTRKQQELAKVTSEAETVRPDSKRVRELEEREKVVIAGEQSVVAREEAILVREQRAREIADKIGAFTGLNS